jgi:uncharacterized MAPEG superfamily protein
MTTDLWYLACMAMLTAALWIPYIVCQVTTNGPLSGENYVDPAPRPVPLWGQRAHRAYLNAVECLAPFAVLVIVAQNRGKSGWEDGLLGDELFLTQASARGFRLATSVGGTLCAPASFAALGSFSGGVDPTEQGSGSQTVVTIR